MYSWIALVPCPIPIIFNSLGNRRECRFLHPLLHHQIRQIGAHLPLLRGGVLLKVVGHGDVQQGIVLCLLPPYVAGAEVGEGDDLATEEDFHAVVELAESAGGEPEEFRKDCGADDRSLLDFYHGDEKFRAEGSRCSHLRKGTVFPKIIIDITTISFNRVVFLRKCIIFAQMKPKKQKLCLYDL